jgi:glutamine---fructose-6-phosphate transaminase (isomerizing)
MCGIVGVVGRQDIAPLLVEALRRLEYRGYDSAGVAAISEARIGRRRVEGKVQRLADRLAEEPLPGRTAIAHTRWATHGAPCERNAHPIATDRVAVVHNGIIENYRELRDELEWLGHRFETQTDTEAVAVLLTRCLQQGMTPAEAVSATLGRVSGAFALAILFAGHEDMLVCARRGSPLAIGYGEGEMFVGSDALALGPMTQRISYLEDGDWALLTPAGAQVCDAAGNPVHREIRQSTVSGAAVGKGNHRHYMQKEIFEQPAAIGDTLRSLLDPATRGVVLPPLPFSLAEVERAIIVGCGTSYHAGLVARYWAEGIAGVPVQVDIASEFRYRRTPVPPRTLVVGISQSGETADTLAALRQAKAQGARTLGIVNQPESSMEREVDAVVRTLAGPEIGVASTKAFTTQLVVLACLAIALGRARGAIDGRAEEALVRAIADTPAAIAEVLAADAEMREIAARLAEARDVLYLGRGTAFPIALEGALKLKEISYVHAEGYPAGELKHGPIALIDGSVPVVVVAPPDELVEKTASNMQEVMARGGQVIVISSAEGLARIGAGAVAQIRLPDVPPLAAPLVYAIPMQLLAYHAAVLRGTEVDQPRNLAKSVTVE